MMMMRHGSNGYGGSPPSSASSLSALAPPFKVDRSMPKLGSNPLVDFTETTYGLTYNHSLNAWLGPQPPNSRPDYFSSTTMEFESEPASNAFKYSSVEHVAPLNSLVSASVDTDIIGQNSNTLLEAKPYYPSYVSNVIGNGSPLDIPHNSGYDLLSTSQVPTASNSLHEDYTQSLSGIEHSAHWSGCWEGLTDWQQARPGKIDGSFYSKENFFNQGVYASEGIVNFEGASHSIDAVSIEKETKSGFRGQRDYENLLGEIPKFVSSLFPTSTSSASTLQVPETSPLEPLINSWSHQMSYGASYEKFLGKHDATSDIFPVINSSPANLIGPMAQDSSLLRDTNAISDRNSEAIPSNNPCGVMEPHPYISSDLNVASIGDYKVFGGNNSSFILEPDLSTSSKSSVCYDASQASSCSDKNEKVVSGFPLGQNKEVSSNGTVPMDSLDQAYGKKSRIQVPPASLDISIIVGDKNEETKSYLENADHYNPAVDSPCWKGAPVSHFSKFEVSEAFIPPSTKEVEDCGGPKLQAHSVSDLCGNDAENVFPEKTNSNLMPQESWSKGSCLTPLKTPTVDYLLITEEIDDAAKAESCYTKPICFDGVKIADDSLSKNDADTKLSHSEQHGSEGDEWTSEKICEASVGVTNNGVNVIDDPNDFSSQVALHAIENVLRSPPSVDDAPSKFIEPHGRESTQKMHVRTLIDTMRSLSELLVFQLSSNACEWKKDDCDALKDVIHNLDLCMYKTVERSERITSPLLGDSSNHQKDPIENGSQASGIHHSNVQGPVKHQLVHDVDSRSVTGKNDEKLSNLVAEMSAGDILKDNSMIQALKKALVENFDAEEETDPHVLLYKNLWLEAEASLCSASCIARFNRMKNEMENHNSQTTNGNTVFMEKVSKSEVSFDPDAANTLSSGAKGIPLPNSSLPLSSFVIASSNEDDVAARFNILRCRIDGSNTKNTSYADMLGDASDKLSTCESVKNMAVEEKCMPSNANDFEDSFMSRIHIHKYGDENSTYMDAAEAQRQRQSFPKISENAILDAKMEAGLKVPSTEDKVDVKEFYQIMEDNRRTKSRMASRAGDQPRTALADGSSDWEHVLLEELRGLGS